MRLLAAAVLATMGLSGAADAAIADKSAAGFEVVETATVAAPPAKVWAALLAPGAWWSSRHSWSGDARNLRLDLAGGCFCEALPHGSVRHMTVVYNDGATTLRMFGALGPLQMTGAAGHLSFVLKANGSGTEVTATYDVGGYVKGGIETWAAPVDSVLGEQVGRLRKYVETGKPD